MRSMCRHCNAKFSIRPRGLCWVCYYKAGVRDLYPPTSKFARRGVGNFCGNRPLPETHTCAAPGSEEKILILMERAAKSQSLFHPQDAYADQVENPILSVPRVQVSFYENPMRKKSIKDDVN